MISWMSEWAVYLQIQIYSGKAWECVTIPCFISLEIQMNKNMGFVVFISMSSMFTTTHSPFDAEVDSEWIDVGENGTPFGLIRPWTLNIRFRSGSLKIDIIHFKAEERYKGISNLNFVSFGLLHIIPLRHVHLYLWAPFFCPSCPAARVNTIRSQYVLLLCS